MRIGSLFSGYGGLDMAVESVFPGAAPAWFCEWDDAPSKVLAHHWPDVPNYRDVTVVDWEAVQPVDIITGGYPCQPFSAAGRREGTNDERHLWPHVREAVRVLRPRYVVLENVAGHRSLGFDRVLGDMAEDGIHVRWTSVRASDIGAPHHRERLFILATPSDAASDSGRVGDGDSQHAADAQGVGPGEHVESFLAGVPASVRRGGADVAADTGGDGCRWGAERNGEQVGSELEAPRGGHTHRRGDSSSDAASSGRERETVSGIQRGEPTDRCGIVPADPDGIGQYGRRSAPEQAGGSHAAAGRHSAGVEWGAYAPAVRRWERLTRPAPAPTEPNTKGKPRLNAEFAEWMMGLPAGHVTGVGLPRTAQLKAIGNGVCPQQAAAALEQLLALEAVVA